MNQNKLQKLYERLSLSSVFIGVTCSPLFAYFAAFCKRVKNEKTERLSAYAAFVAEIYREGGDLTELVQRLIFEDENPLVKTVAKGETPSEYIQNAAKWELQAYSEFASLTAQDFAVELDEKELPAFASRTVDLRKAYAERLEKIGSYGYGIFSTHGSFRLTDEGEIEPIVSADKIQMTNFVGYEQERERVRANTYAFLAGKPAANVLLFGDAGTGKSSTVKAIANAFYGEGLRLIELRKDQLRLLPKVMDKISGNPLKFIIFLDDLSFNRTADDFSMLKAALEGSASAKAENAVIYATSNRRHIVREQFSDREGDDVHRNDTMQETLSLSERFGLTVYFCRPDKKLYLQIVDGLARRNGIELKQEELFLQAEAFALSKGSRSARCAEQFVEGLKKLPGTKEARQLQRHFMAGAAEVETDKQGRFLVPAKLREQAGLTKDVVFVGVVSKIELWSKERWEQNCCYDNMDEVAEPMAEFGLNF